MRLVSNPRPGATPSPSLPGDQKPLGEWPLVATLLVALAAWEAIDLFILGSGLLEALTPGLAPEPRAVVRDLLRLALVSVILFGVGRIRPRTLGLGAEKLPHALLILVSIWGLTQITLITDELMKNGVPVLDWTWRHDGWERFGHFAAVAGSEALGDEMLWRGYLMAWAVAQLRPRWSDPGLGTGIAVLASQSVFALYQIPQRMSAGMPGSHVPIDLVVIMLTGAFYGLLYLRTRNLFVPIGVHALSRVPMPLVEPSLDPARLLILISAVLLIPLPERNKPPGDPVVDSLDGGKRATDRAASDA